MTNFEKIYSWRSIQNLESKSFLCGFCGNDLASEKGWDGSSGNGQRGAYIYICHKCTRPTFFDFDDKQTPGAKFGEDVEGVLDSSVSNLYDEARNCMSVGSYTASVLCSRKLLMNIAVSKGADEGKNFVTYVKYLADNHYVPPNSDDWVDHIRKKGNEATHEIAIMKREDAEELISFIEMILKFIFEFPARMQKKSNPTTP